MSSAANNRPQGASFEYERLSLPQASSSDSTRRGLSSDKVMHIRKIYFDAQADVTLLSANSYKVEDTIGINREIQIQSFLFSTRAQA